MNITYVVLLILLLIYIPFYFYVRSSESMKEKGIVTYGPFIMFKTKRGVGMLDRAAKYKRFWRVFGTISKVMAFFLMAVILFIIIIDLLFLPLMMDTPGIGVEYALAIPGLNPMLPLVYGVIGLIVAVAIHEIAHGIQTRANGMDVESMGVLYAVVPVGAFVEPNEEQIKKSSRKARTDMFSAGIAINLTAAMVIFLVMSMGVMGTMSSDFGDRAAVVNVSADSPAHDSNIGYSAIIWGVQTDKDDQNTFIAMTHSDIMEYPFDPGHEYLIRYAVDGNEMNTAVMYMGVFITGIAKGSPAEAAGITKNAFITKIGTDNITGISSFRDAMSSHSPGDAVTVETRSYESDGTLGAATAFDITLGNNGGRAYLGVNYSLSGFSFTTPDEVLLAAKNPFQDAGSISDAAYSAISYIGKPFRGHSPIQQEVQWWYHSSFLSDGALWILLQTLFWIFWLNLVLAVTNALPAIPFDGGHLYRDGVGALVDRTHKHSTPEHREAITNKVTAITSYTMLFALLLVMVAIVL